MDNILEKPKSSPVAASSVATKRKILFAEYLSRLCLATVMPLAGKNANADEFVPECPISGMVRDVRTEIEGPKP